VKKSIATRMIVIRIIKVIQMMLMSPMMKICKSPIANKAVFIMLSLIHIGKLAIKRSMFQLVRNLQWTSRIVVMKIERKRAQIIALFIKLCKE
jgi:hypothetical protein